MKGKKCAVCGNVFAPRTVRHLTCSAECSAALDRLRNTERVASWRANNPDRARQLTRSAMARFRQNVSLAGLRQITLWVHDDDRDALRDFALSLLKARAAENDK